jgi:hypothetical protein
MRFFWALLGLAILVAPLTGCVVAVRDHGDHDGGHSPPPDDWHDHRN